MFLTKIKQYVTYFEWIISERNLTFLVTIIINFNETEGREEVVGFTQIVFMFSIVFSPLRNLYFENILYI